MKLPTCIQVRGRRSGTVRSLLTLPPGAGAGVGCCGFLFFQRIAVSAAAHVCNARCGDSARQRALWSPPEQCGEGPAPTSHIRSRGHGQTAWPQS